MREGCAVQSHPAPRRPRGFTLVELLITITIIGILAAVMLGALSATRQSARVAKTRSTVAKIHRVIMDRYESYRTRRVPMDLAAYALATYGNSNRPSVERARINGLLDLMRMEMPDRWSDVTGAPLVLPVRPALNYRYQRAYNLAIARVPATGYTADEWADVVSLWGASELLYLVVMSSPDAASQFSEVEVGDVDQDGLLEFHDGWGRPIRFLRWPVGFIPYENLLAINAGLDPGGYANEPVIKWGAPSDLQHGDANLEPDPFDPTRLFTGPRRFAIYPLIYSAGPDKIFDINIGYTQSSGDLVQYAYQLNGASNLEIYGPDGYTTNGNRFIGQPMDSAEAEGRNLLAQPANSELNSLDNIHNHRLGIR